MRASARPTAHRSRSDSAIVEEGARRRSKTSRTGRSPFPLPTTHLRPLLDVGPRPRLHSSLSPRAELSKHHSNRWNQPRCCLEVSQVITAPLVSSERSSVSSSVSTSVRSVSRLWFTSACVVGFALLSGPASFILGPSLSPSSVQTADNDCRCTIRKVSQRRYRRNSQRRCRMVVDGNRLPPLLPPRRLHSPILVQWVRTTHPDDYGHREIGGVAHRSNRARWIVLLPLLESLDH